MRAKTIRIVVTVTIFVRGGEDAIVFPMRTTVDCALDAVITGRSFARVALLFDTAFPPIAEGSVVTVDVKVT
jgi:hypothetical protein